MKARKTQWVCVGGRVGGNSKLSNKMYKLVIAQYGSDILGVPNPMMIEVVL